jgi:hypothetical protein
MTEKEKDRGLELLNTQLNVAVLEDKLYPKTIEKWGKQAQVLMAIEEMGELLQVLSKITRKVNGCSKSDVVDEIVDVDIMMGQLKVIFDVNELVYLKIKERKLKRLKEMIEK